MSIRNSLKIPPVTTHSSSRQYSADEIEQMVSKYDDFININRRTLRFIDHFVLLQCRDCAFSSECTWMTLSLHILEQSIICLEQSIFSQEKSFISWEQSILTAGYAFRCLLCVNKLYLQKENALFQESSSSLKSPLEGVVPLPPSHILEAINNDVEDELSSPPLHLMVRKQFVIH